MDSLVSTFHIDWRLMVAQAVNFTIVMIVLYYFAFRPLMKLMDERAKTVAKGLKDSEESAKRLKEAQTEYKKIVAEAQVKASQALEKSRQNTLSESSEILARAKKETELLLTNGRRQLESEKKKIVEEARVEVADLVVQATEKVLQNKYL